jgi:hypothetical protein
MPADHAANKTVKFDRRKEGPRKIPSNILIGSPETSKKIGRKGCRGRTVSRPERAKLQASPVQPIDNGARLRESHVKILQGAESVLRH